METSITQLLILEVQKNPVLYDRGHRLPKDVSKKEIWDAIGAKVGLTGDDAKKRWRYIRDAFMYSIKRGKVKHEQSATKVKPYKFAKDLQFLVPVLTGKDRRSTMDIGIVNEILKGQSDHGDDTASMVGTRYDMDVGSCEVAVETGREALGPMETSPEEKGKRVLRGDNSTIGKNLLELQPLNARNVSRTVDETDKFFLSMSAMVKKLPLRTQAVIKFELHKLIHQAEIEFFPFQLAAPSGEQTVVIEQAEV